VFEQRRWREVRSLTITGAALPALVHAYAGYAARLFSA
jgi:hypothetical protein